MSAPVPRRLPPASRNCAHCDREFYLVGTRRSYFCTSTCERAHSVSLKTARAVARLAAKPRCAECDKPARKRGLCCTHYNRKYQPNRSHGPVGIVEWKKLNPKLAKAHDKDKQHRRRARLNGSQVEVIDRQVVGERDGWRCGICHRKISQALQAPHPMSQSLDHIEPVSMGGHHTYANVRIAHLKCNIERGNRGDVQLALFG